MKFILSNRYVRYNANSSGRNTSDCVCRALSIAYNLSYSDTHNQLTKLAGRGNKWNIPIVFETFIYDNGCENTISQVDPITVEEFSDTLGQQGTYILLTSSASDRRVNRHMTCVIDGTLYDSWNSSKYYVYKYYIVSGIASERDFERSGQYVDNLAEYAKDEAIQLSSKYLQYFKDYDPKFEVEAASDSSVIRLDCALRATIADTDVMFSFEVGISIPLSATEDEAKSLVDKTIKIRLYDRFAAIKLKFSNKVEELAATAEYGQGKTIYLYDRERRFYNSLPGWIKPLVTYVYVYTNYDGYPMYELKCKPLKDDPRSDTQVEFEGESVAQIRDQINRYKADYSRLYEDYLYDDTL